MTMPRRKKGAKASKKDQAAKPRSGGGTPAGEVTLLRHEKPRPAHATLIVGN